MAGLVVVVLVAALVRVAWAIGHREQGGPITQAQARENAAPLTRAILASDDYERECS